MAPRRQSTQPSKARKVARKKTVKAGTRKAMPRRRGASRSY